MRRGRVTSSISCWLWGEEPRFVTYEVMRRKMKKRRERRHVINICVRVRGVYGSEVCEMKFGVGGGG